MHMSSTIRITDVGPRDGLQNEAGAIATADKARLVRLLLVTGVDEIEVTSFVSPKWVPQLGDSSELCRRVADDLRRLEADRRAQLGENAPPLPMLSALVPNEKGMEGAVRANEEAAGLGRPLLAKVSVFTAASETFSLRNTNATIQQTLDRFKPVIEAARARSLLVRGYVSCVIACPFEGPIAPAKVARVCERLVDLGVDEIDLGDTIGAGTPATTAAMLRDVERAVGAEWTQSSSRCTLHLHDTFGLAAECVRAALDSGVCSFDASIAGLGGCPYASTPGKRAPGNIAMHTLVAALRGAGHRLAHVNDAAMSKAAAFAGEIVAAAREKAASGNSAAGAQG